MDGEDVLDVEGLRGVYLLLSLNPRYRGRTYVGFTVNPSRRLKQHNGGFEAGGAARTSNRGPWAMLLIVEGFPNNISALRFEWAWQNPQKSRRLCQLQAKTKKESALEHKVRVLGEMLLTGPWNRLPLRLRWLRPDIKAEKKLDLDPDRQPPLHVAITYGAIEAARKTSGKKAGAQDDQGDDASNVVFVCSVCLQEVPEVADRVCCISPKCATVSHLTCLADHFRRTSTLDQRHYFLPLDGSCPVCDIHCLWGDIIRKKQGCFKDLPFQRGAVDV